MTDIILPPPRSTVANDILYKECPFCGAPKIPALSMFKPQLLKNPDKGGADAVICTNPRCGGCAPVYSWNNRYTPLQLVK